MNQLDAYIHDDIYTKKIFLLFSPVSSDSTNQIICKGKKKKEYDL